MQKKYLKIILIITLVIITVLIAAYIFINFTKVDSATKTFDTYKNKYYDTKKKIK